jgi:hypothetical protein
MIWYKTEKIHEKNISVTMLIISSRNWQGSFGYWW